MNDNERDSILFLMERSIIQKKDFIHLEDKITTKQFVTMVIRSSKGDIEPTRDDWSSGYLDYAIHKGIMEDYDMTNINNPLERRCAARIVHEALMTEFFEKDEIEWSAANKLIDLYSCRTCVMHIAQVYVKGIMLGCEDNLFNLSGNITVYEAADILVRMLHKKRRIPPIKLIEAKSKLIHPNEAWEIMTANRRTLLIDVRSYEEYREGHIDGSICKPLHDLFNNPCSVCIRKDTPIILYCQKGYKSSLAAQALIDAGYNIIYTIPGLEQYQYSLTR